MKKVKLFLIILFGFMIITISGCTNSQPSEENDLNNNNNPVENSNGGTENESSDVINSYNDNLNYNDKVDSEIPKNEATGNDSLQEYNQTDMEVMAYFNELEANVSTELNSGSLDTIKDKMKGTFITIVDFIFYGGEIKGIKFDDLTEGAKQNILETATTIDNAIMTKFPNYKEEISSTVSNAYNKASDLIKKGANNVKEFSKEKLGEENYNSIIAAKDELVYYTKNAVSIIGDTANSIWDKSKETIKNWYENFRKN